MVFPTRILIVNGRQNDKIRYKINGKKTFSRNMAKKTTKTIGYLRVSTADQDLEKNKADILHLANEKKLGTVEWVEEKTSGTVSWRKRKVAHVIEGLSEGDAIIVSELSRLGRSMLECMELLSIVTQKGIHIYAVKGNWQLDGAIQSKIIAMAFGMFINMPVR